MNNHKARLLLGAVMGTAMVGPALADTCKQLSNSGLTYVTLANSLKSVVNEANTPNGGLGFPMWLTLIDGSGTVCAVVNSLSGTENPTADIWLGSRVISAQKANAANSFSTGKLALSTANLYSAVQPGGSLYGLQHSNPVDTATAYGGTASKFGTNKDPMVGRRIGGINVFGGGLTLYNSSKKKVGAIGVSGDTSCTDHVVAWKVRDKLVGFEAKNVPGGVASTGNDALIQDITENPTGGTGVSAGGFGHPTCLNNPTNAIDGGSIDGN
ncbi:GlcG/HbpS family heme-binding protein [Methylomagnum sp.]